MAEKYQEGSRKIAIWVFGLVTKINTEGARLLELLPAFAGLPPRPDMYVTGFRAEVRRKGKILR